MSLFKRADADPNDKTPIENKCGYVFHVPNDFIWYFYKKRKEFLHPLVEQWCPMKVPVMFGGLANDGEAPKHIDVFVHTYGVCQLHATCQSSIPPAPPTQASGDNIEAPAVDPPPLSELARTTTHRGGTLEV